jgi:hypothetical protein
MRSVVVVHTFVAGSGYEQVSRRVGSIYCVLQGLGITSSTP